MTTLTLTERRTFGKTNLDVSPLGFGGAPIGVLDAEVEQVRRVLGALLDRGVNVIDTAACYKGSEELIGKAIADRRDDYVLISKCGHNIEQDGRNDFSREVIEESIDRSLSRLQTDHLDVILLHSCDLDTLKDGTALSAVAKARDAGKVRFIGYSGDNEAAAWACGQRDISVLQTSISICDQANINVVLPEARKNNIGVIAKRPIGNAAWKTIDEQYEQYRNYSEPYHNRFRAMNLATEMLQEHGFNIARPTGELWAEVALRFTLSVDGVHTAIVGTTRPEHVESNIEAVNKGPLPGALIDAIGEAFRKADDGTWKGLT